jgi:hypothetical protein
MELVWAGAPVMLCSALTTKSSRFPETTSIVEGADKNWFALTCMGMSAGLSAVWPCR